MHHAHDRHRPHIRTLALRLIAAAALLFSSGCRQGPNPDLAGPSYPEPAQGKTIDVQVVRDETIIRLTNTTARAFGKSRLWVNRWYSRPIDKFDVGQTLVLNLGEFRDEHGEAFLAGGFFAIKKPEPLVMAQLQTEQEMLGLVVVSARED